MAEANKNKEQKHEDNQYKDKKSRKDAEKTAKEIESLKAEFDEKSKELEEKKKEIEEKDKIISEQQEKYLRVLAEYDNYRKRTQSEKDGIYTEASFDVLKDILPVIDSLEMALQYNTDSESVVKGVNMTLTQFTVCLEKLGVSEIECKKFDPNLHNAVMHIDDEQYGESEIIQIFRKGYIKGEKVLRHAMVKVAN